MVKKSKDQGCDLVEYHQELEQRQWKREVDRAIAHANCPNARKGIPCRWFSLDLRTKFRKWKKENPVT